MMSTLSCFSGEILRLFLSAVRPAVCGGHRHHDRRPHEQVEGEGGSSLVPYTDNHKQTVLQIQ